jgi:hypothetical protein
MIGYGIYNFKLRKYMNWNEVGPTIDDIRDLPFDK